MDDEYVPVWQTWSFVGRTGPRTALESERTATALEGTRPWQGVTHTTPAEEFRLRLQTARIDRRMSIAELAQRVRCDVETLSAFERGTEVIDADMQARLRSVLGLR